MMSVLRISITRKSDVLLFYQIAAAVIFIIFLMVFSYKFSVREVVSAGILSILFDLPCGSGLYFHIKNHGTILYGTVISKY